MSDNSQPGARLQYQDWKRQPRVYREPTHEDWVRELEESDATISRLREELHRMQEYVENLRRPEPYRISRVIGKADKLDYALQIERVIDAYPEIVVEVRLPHQPSTD